MIGSGRTLLPVDPCGGATGPEPEDAIDEGPVGLGRVGFFRQVLLVADIARLPVGCCVLGF